MSKMSIRSHIKINDQKTQILCSEKYHAGKGTVEKVAWSWLQFMAHITNSAVMCLRL